MLKKQIVSGTKKKNNNNCAIKSLIEMCLIQEGRFGITKPTNLGNHVFTVTRVSRRRQLFKMREIF